MIISGISLPEKSVADQTVIQQAFSTSLPLVRTVELCSIGLETLSFINSQSSNYGFISSSDILETFILYYPNEIPIQYQIPLPPSYECRLLNFDDAFGINELWRFKSETSIITLQDILSQSDCSFGIVFKETGKLVAWVMENENGAFGMLNCVDGHTRQGLAKFLILKIAGKFREVGRPVFCAVVCGNDVSLKLHTSVGFWKYREISGWQSFEIIAG